MRINADINIERSPDIPGYVLIKEEVWQHILTILQVKGVNINFLGEHAAANDLNRC